MLCCNGGWSVLSACLLINKQSLFVSGGQHYRSHAMDSVSQVPVKMSAQSVSDMLEEQDLAPDLHGSFCARFYLFSSLVNSSVHSYFLLVKIRASI